MGLFTKDKEESEEVEETDAEEEEAEEDNNYEMDLTCSNCGEENTVQIPLGTTWKDWAKTNKCPVCECIGVLSVEEYEE